jgi:hypothetical protein
MKVTEAEHCERTGRLIGHCGCGECYARKLAEMARQDAALRAVSQSRRSYPRYLVTASL